MNTNTEVASTAVLRASQSGDWDGVLHLYKVVSVATKWNATDRGILHEALVKANAL